MPEEHDHGLSDEQFRQLTKATRAADEAHQTSGGGTRHWLRECFIPQLEAHGLQITARRLPHKGWTLGRLIVTTCQQAAGAPLLDYSFVNDQEGRRYVGKTLALAVGRNEYGERPRARALVVGWRK